MQAPKRRGATRPRYDAERIGKDIIRGHSGVDDSLQPVCTTREGATDPYISLKGPVALGLVPCDRKRPLIEFREAGARAERVRSVLAERSSLPDARLVVRALCLCLFLLVGWITTSSAAPPRGDDVRHRLELSWQAPSQCPGSEVFTAEVGALTASIDWVRGDPDAKEVRVVLVPGEGRGSLVMLDQSDEILSRDVTERDCAVMVRGLAFVLAVLLDPSVKMEAAPNTEAETADVPSEKTDEAVESDEVAEQTTLALSDEPRNEPINDPPERLLPRPRRSTSPLREPTKTFPTDRDPPERRVAALHTWHLFAGGSLESGLNTDWAPGATASVQGRFHRVDQGDHNLRSARLLSPSFRIGGQFVSSLASESDENLDVFRYGGFLQLCPFWIPTTARIRVSPCLAGELGAVRAEGREVDRSMPARRPWGALVALARMDVSLGRVDVGVSAGSRIHITRYGFSVDSEGSDKPSEILYETPRFSAVFELSIGLEVFRSKNARTDIH